MPVYFVYRCHSGAPSEKHVWRFDHDTVLDWAKDTWKLHDTRKKAEHCAEELFGKIDIGPLWGLFYAEPQQSLSHAPRSMADVKRWFSDSMYCEEEAHGAHHIQCLTEWSDNQRSVHVFDDHFRAKKPGKADFLLLDGWELPAGDSDAPAPKLPRATETKPRGDTEGALYFVSTFVDCKYNLEDLCDAFRIAKLRVPDLVRYLLLHSEPDDLFFPLDRVRAALLDILTEPKGADAGFLVAIRDQPNERTNWSAYSDWLEDRDLPPAGLHLLDRALRSEKSVSRKSDTRRPELDLVKVAPHMAQVCKHEGRYPDQPGKELTKSDWFEQFIFFDDRWAAAHPTLAAGVLTFASKWDVLS